MGRGSSGLSSKAGGIRINNPAGIPSNAITLDEFYALRGVPDAASGVGIDRYAGANMTRMSANQRQETLNEMNKQNDDYYKKRQEAREEYQRLVKEGKIRDKTPIEKMLTKANGNPDNPSTQAARRMATKRGYDWKTGKRLKK